MTKFLNPSLTAETLRSLRFFPKSEIRNPKFELPISNLPTSAPSACVALAKQASRPSREPAVHLSRTNNYRLLSSALRPLPSVHGLRTFSPSHNFTPVTHKPLNPFIPRRPSAAFSLTEVVIALGIFAISMIGILALFPVASATGRESSEETQAAIIAQTVFSDLRSSAANRGATNAWLVSGKNTFTDFVRPINLANPTNIFIAYDIKRRDWADSSDGGAPLVGPPLSLKAMQVVSEDEYQSGVPNPASTTHATYASHLRVQPLAGLNGMAQASLEVSTPGGFPRANRRIFTFSTLVTGP